MITLEKQFRHKVKNEHGVFLDTQNVFDYFKKTYDYVDVATYTVSYTDSFKIGRLIIGSLNHKNNVTEAEEVRYAPAFHSKLYIGWISKHYYPYVGSLNCVDPCRMHNILVQIEARNQKKKLLEYFNAVWEKSEEVKQSLLLDDYEEEVGEF